MDTSRKYIAINCEICNAEYFQQERVNKIAKWKARCPKCRKIIKFCPDCGEKIWYKSNKCNKCWKDKLPKKYCVQCGVEILRHSTVCLRCHNKNQDKGLSKERIKFQANKKWKKLRIQCFERDDYTCNICNNKDGELNAHHILSYKEYEDKRLELNNLMTLCRECHEELHWGKQ